MVFSQFVKNWERPSQEERNGANFRFVAPSSEELLILALRMVKVVTTVDLNSHNSSLEGATKLKFASICSP